jgi:hypothetical protein
VGELIEELREGCEWKEDREEGKAGLKAEG